MEIMRIDVCVGSWDVGIDGGFDEVWRGEIVGKCREEE